MIEVTFSSSTKEASAFGLTQWDKGQKLKIVWADLPEEFQVHFSSRSSQEAIVAEARGQSGVAVVDIPDELLKSSEDIIAWVYLTEGGNTGESVKRAVLYVRPRAKPGSLIDDLEMTQQEILENILADVKQNIQHIKENGTDAEYLPSYVIEEAEDVLSKVQGYQKENSLVFIAASDAHFKNGDYNSETGIRHMSQAMKLIKERYPVDFCVYLGDMTSGGSSKDLSEGKIEIMKTNAALQNVLCSLPSFILSGSEDYLLKSYYRNGAYISQIELNNLIGRWNRNMTRPQYYESRGYFYKDFDELKVRVICLNTSDTYGTLLNAASETAVMSSSQLQWLCESLDLSGKDTPNSWGIILFGHHPLNMLGKFPLAVNILEAYNKGTSVNVAGADGNIISYDFSGKNKAKIFAQFHGHLHNYKVNFITENSIPVVAIPNAGFYNNNFYTADTYTQEENLTYGENLTYNKTVNSANDTAFCVIVIDKATGKIHAVHYGAGVDRTIDGTIVIEDSADKPGSGDEGNTGGDSEGTGGDGESGEDNDESTVTYTNLVPTSKTTSGVIHNSVGYTDGYKLNSQGSIVYGPGYTHTGYMNAYYGDTIRVSGGTFDGTAGNYLFVFDGQYNLIWVATLKGTDEAESGICYNSGVLEFYPARVQTGNLEDMAYIRVSTVGVGADLIVTRNEQIGNSSDSGESSNPSVSYTNILEFATDENGNTYGTGGYSDGKKLTADGAEATASGYTVSGYLSVDSDAVIRTKGLTYDGSEGCVLCIYDSSYSLIKCITLGASSDSANGIAYSGGIHTFTPADVATDLDGMAYFRISGKGTGSKLVITYCEEIA